MDEKDWIKALKEGECKYVELVPFPTATPQYFQGYKMICGLNGEDCKGSCEISG